MKRLSRTRHLVWTGGWGILLARGVIQFFDRSEDRRRTKNDGFEKLTVGQLAWPGSGA